MECPGDRWEAGIRRRAAALFPMGSPEEHGPHAATGDHRAAEEIALRVAKQTGHLLFPALPFGCSECFRHFPGTITLSTWCGRQSVGDVIDCLIGSGFRRIILVHGYKGNQATRLHLVRDLGREKHLPW